MRRVYLLGIAILFLCLMSLSSCSYGMSNSQETLRKHKGQILFFSNESNYMSENEYYEALLDLKKAYPVEIDKLQLMDTEKNKLEMESLKVSSFPAIVVISKEGEITRTISGEKATRQAITKTVSDAIEINQKSTLTSR